MKKIFYVLSFVICLSACREKVEEKTFLNKYVKNYLELNDLEYKTARLKKTDIHSKMSEIKSHIYDQKLSQNCEKARKYVSGYMDIIYSSIQKSMQDFDNYRDESNNIDNYYVWKNYDLTDYLLDNNLLESSIENSKIRTKSEIALNNFLDKNSCEEYLISRKYTDLFMKEIKKFNPNSLELPNYEKIKEYIDKGADVNERDEYFSSPLLNVISSDKTNILEIVKLLIEHGANVNDVINGETALICVVRSSNPQALEIVKFLVENGANINAKDTWWGETVLMHASDSSNSQALDIVRYLIEKGVDVNAQNILGTTALTRASESEIPQKDEIIKLLKEHGTK